MKRLQHSSKLVAVVALLSLTPARGAAQPRGEDEGGERTEDTPTAPPVAERPEEPEARPDAAASSDEGEPGERAPAPADQPAPADEDAAEVEEESVPVDEGSSPAGQASDEAPGGEEAGAEDEAWDDEALFEEIEAEVEAEVVDEGATDPSSSDAEASEAEAAGDDEVDVQDPATLTEDDLELGAVEVRYLYDDVFRTGGGVSVVTEEELETYEYDDPHSVLLRVPGVYVRGEDGYGLRPNIGLRGSRSERSSSITLMEDGVLFGPAPYSAPAAYYFPITTRMVGMEVFKGPAAILYGPQTVGGALNLQTRQVPEEAGGEIDAAYGRFRFRKLHLHYGASNDWGGFLFEGVDIATVGFKDIDFTNRETGFHRSEFMLRGFVQTDPSAHVYHRLELKLGFSRERSNETYLGLTDQDFEDDPYRRYVASERDQMRWHRYQVEATHRLAVGSTVDLRTTIYRHDFDRVWRRMDRFENGPSLFRILTNPQGAQERPFLDILRGDTDTFTDDERLILAINDREFVSQGIQSKGRFIFVTGAVRHEIEAGVRLHYDEIERNHGAVGFRMQNQELVSDGLDRPDDRDELAQSLAFAAYLMYALEIGKLNLYPGLRFEYIHNEFEDRLTSLSVDGNQHIVLPGIGAQYTIAEHLGLLAGVHRGFAPVAPGQDSSVEPETAISYEAGARYYDEEQGITAELVGFLNDYSNLLLNCNASGGCTSVTIGSQFNAGSVLVGGFEAVYGHRFDLSASLELPFRVTYTFTKSRITDLSDDPIGTPDFANAEDGDSLPYVPEHQLAVNAGVEHDDFGVTLAATYVGAMPEVAGGALGTDDYLMLDMVGRYRPFDRVEVYLRLENLLNAQPITARRPFGARPTRPFQVQAGLKFQL